MIAKESQKRAAILLAVVTVCVLFPQYARAWGRNGNKLVLNKAIETLPPDIRDFFEANRAFLLQHVTDPLDAMSKTPAERHNHFLYLDKYGRFPFDALPRSYKAAVAKFGKTKIAANGLLPWQVGVYSQKLTEALKAGRWDEAKLDAAILADYVAETHDPFNTTDDFDGHLSGQLGINDRFGTTLVDRYSSFFPMRPTDATFISDPTDFAFEACLTSHSSLEMILLADRNSRHGEKSYTDEYYDRFYNQSAVILIRQLSSAATDVGSYWLTAWVNAGRPQLPH
ncbi:MAG TPA: hypothetical protein VOA64_08305 [Candidatus Dormibacteraeota bacterium]|nr:hypothetical protein [Candidatus Dormibacteraeota bacterium]